MVKIALVARMKWGFGDGLCARLCGRYRFPQRRARDRECDQSSGGTKYMWQRFVCDRNGHTYLSTSAKRQVKKVKEKESETK